jgi:hypothetical protein
VATPAAARFEFFIAVSVEGASCGGCEVRASRRNLRPKGAFTHR